MNYWVVGATHGETKDVSKEFLDKNIWYDGYAEEGDERDKDTLKELKVGDILLMKSSSTKGPNHSITFTKLKGIGKIIEKVEYYSFKVQWTSIKNLPLDFDGISYRKTIELAREDQMLDYAKFIMEKEIPQEAKVIYAYLVKSLSHRAIQREILGEEAPANGGGFLTMTILHNYELRKEKKGILKHKKIEDELKIASGKYLEALQLLKKYYTELVDIQPQVQNNMSKNIILYGPPGTGKTYESIDYAVKIATGASSDEHSENKDVFDELRTKGQIDFVTFHQNYSYEDFMVGIKPNVTEGSETLTFKKHYGIFYEITQRAKENYLASLIVTGKLKSVQELINELLDKLRSGEKIELQTSTKIKFTISYISESTLQLIYSNGSTNNTLSVDTLQEITEGKREFTTSLKSYYYPLKDYLLSKQVDVKTEKVAQKNFVLVIDEINRANISKVFGELITLLEDDKRLGEENELKVSLPNGEKEFGVPPNLFIIGTMNTADKSIALIDIALRRRFEFIGFYPKYEGYNSDAITLLQKINTAIFEAKKKSADYLIGHAYFMNHLSIETILKNKVVPLLMEYFSGKTEIVTGIFDGTDWNVNYNFNTYSWDISKK
jgi:5-methylcytosine-specific restriction protein B